MTKPKEGTLLPKHTGQGTGLDAPGKQHLRDKVKKALETYQMSAVFGVAFEELGGVERLIDWGNENYSEFIRTFTTVARTSGGGTSGKIQIQINNKLGPSELDE
jgi:hypothetical protein